MSTTTTFPPASHHRVSLERGVAAPFATQLLAYLGAPGQQFPTADGGDFTRAYDTTAHGHSNYFLWLNRPPVARHLRRAHTIRGHDRRVTRPGRSSDAARTSP
jgi:crotonobetainyl-CoA:carnitine CoA-transferase CaiB-like acyl-CoA transferase